MYYTEHLPIHRHTPHRYYIHVTLTIHKDTSHRYT